VARKGAQRVEQSVRWKWIYRSYLNEPSMPVFGEGTITFDDAPIGHLAG
jgi:hypothetical protein